MCIRDRYNLIQRNSEKFYSVNLVYRTEKEILPYCEKHNLGFLPVSYTHLDVYKRQLQDIYYHL